MGGLTQKQAHYIVAVKNNQPGLASAVESLFEATDAGVRNGRLAQDITLDKDHGRLDSRRCVVAHDLSPMGNLVQAWPGLKSVVMVESIREFINGREKGKSSTEWRYYISSLQLNAGEFNRQIRAHWAIENSCHWVMDMTFAEATGVPTTTTFLRLCFMQSPCGTPRPATPPAWVRAIGLMSSPIDGICLLVNLPLCCLAVSQYRMGRCASVPRTGNRADLIYKNTKRVFYKLTWKLFLLELFILLENNKHSLTIFAGKELTLLVKNFLE